MVSLGDTAISLHILQPPLGGGVLGKVRFGIWKAFHFWRGVYVLGKVRLGLWEEFHFWGRGGVGCSGTKSQNRGVVENLVKNFWKRSLEA